MGLMDLFKGKTNKDDLLQLQKIVVADSPDKLIMSEKQLKSLAATSAQRDLDIIQDCVRIIGTTKKPDTFFSRLDLLVEKADNLRTYEKFLSFKGASPSAAYGEIWSDYQEAIYQFLFRYFLDTLDQADKAKTAKGKLSKFQKFYDSLQPYYERMNAENIDYIETKFRAYTRDLRA